MTNIQLERIIDGKARLVYNGHIFKYDHTEQDYSIETGELIDQWEYFTSVEDGHEISFHAEVIMACPNHFSYVEAET